MFWRQIYSAVIIVAIAAVLAGPLRSQSNVTEVIKASEWVNVTPANVQLEAPLVCGNFGTASLVADPVRAGHLYAFFDCQGVWKSTDFGATWAGPINTGPGGEGVKGAGGLAIAKGADGQPPILYSAGIRGTAMGFWTSLDGGVSWRRHHVGPGGARQDFYKPEVNPYNPLHIIMSGHEMALLVESHDGGRTWKAVRMADGMKEYGGGTGNVYFINTGAVDTTSTTWLWVSQMTGGKAGSWRTTTAGEAWTRVEDSERPHGTMQLYQPDTSGVIYMAGVYSKSGWGVLRSADYGQSWAHVGKRAAQSIVFGTPHKIFAAYSWACGICTIAPDMQMATPPGTGSWTSVPTPAAMKAGPAQTATVFDGKRYIIVSANWYTGLWRYVE